MSELEKNNNPSFHPEYSIDGKLKQYTNQLISIFIIVYLVVIILLFPPNNILSVFLWLYCSIFILLIIYAPNWWLWSTILTICILGFIPNLFGIYNKDVIDGSLFSISNIKQIHVNGIKGRVISLPLLGLPLSLFLWWLRQKRILVPISIIPIAVFCLLMIISSINVCLNYIQISFLPLNIKFIVPEFVEKLQHSRLWWQSGMPFTLMAFTITLAFANLIGCLLLLVMFNLLNDSKRFDYVFSALGISSVICVLYGLAQLKGLVPIFTSGGSLESTFQSQGSYGVFVGISCVFLFNRFFILGDQIIMNLLLFLISLLGLFINQTRTALLALIINPFILYLGYVLFRYKGIEILKKGKKWLLIIVMFFIVSSFVSLCIPSINDYIAKQWKNPFIFQTAISFQFSRGLDSISSGRLNIWSKCIEIWLDKPLFGCGHGQLYWELKKRGNEDAAANQFILVLAEMGIIGFGLFLFVIISIWKDLTRQIFNKKSRWDYSHWLICCSIIICILVQSLTVHVLHFPNLPLLIWAIVGIALASSRSRVDIVAK